MNARRTTKSAAASAAFRAANYLRNEREIAAYLETMLADGDAHAVPLALRTVGDAIGGMAALAERTGLSRETLYRTLSNKGNPRLDTLASILGCFGLRLAVAPIINRSRKSQERETG
jgi:probable addiction module antidote protein